MLGDTEGRRQSRSRHSTMTKPRDVPLHFVKTSQAASRNIRDFAASKLADAMNGFAFVNALFALVESKLWDDLREHGSLDARASAAKHGYHEDQVLGLLRYLVTQDVFKERDRFYPTPFSEAVFSRPALGRLWLYRGGYGQLMFDARELMTGSDAKRDGTYVATGSSAGTSALFDEVGLSILGELGARTIVDLGCGAAEFAITFAKSSADRRAIGIDLDQRAIDGARDNARAAGVADRVKLIAGNAFDVDVLGAHCGDVDVFYMMGLEHELLRGGDDKVLSHIDELAVRFRGKRFLFAEPLLNRTREDGAFYWLHVLSKQGIPLNLNAWTSLLGRLQSSYLEAIYRPDHEMLAAYFSIKLEPRP